MYTYEIIDLLSPDSQYSSALHIYIVFTLWYSIMVCWKMLETPPFCLLILPLKASCLGDFQAI